MSDDTKPKPKAKPRPLTPRDVAEVKLRLSGILFEEIERLDITVGQLAKRAALSDQTCRDIVSGASEPRLSAVMSLEIAIERPPGWLTKKVWAVD